MLQCKDCELCEIDADGKIHFRCDPFRNIKESECLTKWQLIKLDMMVQAYQLTIAQYRKMAPLQEKMIKHLERELDDMDDADTWKQTAEDDKDEPEEEEEEEERY